MVTAKITKFNKISIPVVFFNILCLLAWNIPSFAEFPEYFSLGLTDRECGTLKDPNYRAAFYALQDAMKFLQGRLTKDSDKRSILQHPNPQKLIDDFAGKGIKVTDLPPGAAGYKEVVNFGEFIGYDVNRNTGEKIATSWGKIHYAKDGVHIVPTKPRQ